MTKNADRAPVAPQPEGRLVAKAITGLVTVPLFIWGFFGLAGRWDWPAGWFYVGLLLVAQTLSALLVKRRNPGLLTARSRVGGGTKAWDKIVLGLFGLCYLGILVVGALDAARYGWAPLPTWVIPLGGALYLGGTALLTWAMSTNPHFEKTVRIQTDRQHRVIDSGPYALVRHPGYAGTIGSFVLATPLLLGSAWAFVPAALTTLVLVLRTALEDRALRAELTGYADYAARVRYRLVPGLW